MQALFSGDYALFWAIFLGLALFYPVRQLIWTLAVRRAKKKAPVDEKMSLAMKRRANITAGLLCFVFAYVYTVQLMSGRP